MVKEKLIKAFMTIVLFVVQLFIFKFVAESLNLDFKEFLLYATYSGVTFLYVKTEF